MTPVDVPVVGWLLLKLLVLVGIAVYAVFAGIMVRQERLMAHVLEAGFEPILRLATLIHALASVALFLLAVIFL
jgi:hypothetical protein